ncbi:MAG: hypothetical protein KDL31_11345 [Kiritimatiellae bacterium]|nr:hypothetical protein [Kiritimatiellia bacterium]
MATRRILFISYDFSGASLALRLREEGHDVRAVVLDPVYGRALDGAVPKVASAEEGLAWVGRDGLVVFDNCGLGKLQDQLRSEGYTVVGGSAGGDRLETDREHAQRVFQRHGLTPTPTFTFQSVHEAIHFLMTRQGRWVVKRNGNSAHTACYVGQLDDARDTIDFLRHVSRNDHAHGTRYVLQQRIDGIEIGVARYFNGTDWVGPVELNVEHKDLFAGDMGPKTAEMGTLLWYTDENTRLFREMLAPLKPHLQAIGFRGDIDINCMVNEDGAWPLEVTPRFGYPALQAQMALHQTPWGEFLGAVGRGKSIDLEWHSGYALAVLIAVPPFPFCHHACDLLHSPDGLAIHFRAQPSAEDRLNIHLEGTAVAREEGGQTIRLTDHTGYALHVTGHGQTVHDARRAAYYRADNVVIPRMYYRKDIGESFINGGHARLIRWGWL